MSRESSSGKRSGSRAVPTYGDVRRQLAEKGNPWTVDPRISDDEPLPEYPLGGSPEATGEGPALPRLDPDADVRELIAELPPNDPGLRRDWEKSGMPLDRTPEPTTGDRIDEGGSTEGGRPPGAS